MQCLSTRRFFPPAAALVCAVAGGLGCGRELRRGTVRVDVAATLANTRAGGPVPCAAGDLDVWSVGPHADGQVVAGVPFDSCANPIAVAPCLDDGDGFDTRVVLHLKHFRVPGDPSLIEAPPRTVSLRGDCRISGEVMLRTVFRAQLDTTSDTQGTASAGFDVTGIVVPVSFTAQASCMAGQGLRQFVSTSSTLRRLALVDGALLLPDGSRPPLDAVTFLYNGALNASATPVEEDGHPSLFVTYQVRFSLPGSPLALSLRDVMLFGDPLEAALAAGGGSVHLASVPYIETGGLFDGVASACTPTAGSSVGVIPRLQVDLTGTSALARSARAVDGTRVEALAFGGPLSTGPGTVSPAFVLARASYFPTTLINLQDCPGPDSLDVVGLDATTGDFRAVVTAWDGRAFSFSEHDLPVGSPLFDSCFH